MKKFADDNFKLDEIGRKFSYSVENTEKRRNCTLLEFLLFPRCFQKTCTADTYKPGLVWERINVLCATSGNRLTFPKRQILDSSKLKEFADDNLN